MNIGIMGALVSNVNMGCVALTYSLLGMLERISRQLEKEFKYIIFEFDQDYTASKYEDLKKHMDLKNNQISYVPIGYFNLYDLKLFVKKAKVNLQMLNAMKDCDLVIDITQGDSFTDIYGDDRFYRLSNIKRVVEKLNVPFILGPQTYGPFIKDKNKKYARQIIDEAEMVISRDKQSRDYLSQFCDKKVEIGTDLAFGLLYEKKGKGESNKLRVGINPSGLLCRNKNEKTELETELSVDYDFYIRKLIMLLLSKGMEVYLIPHVDSDGIDSFRDIKEITIHEKFENPVEAKTFISTMDIFIGARMHATIAAFSSGVATIPTAYSRKFSGLYNAVDYNCVVDLTKLLTEEALEQTIAYINDYKQLQENSKKSMNKVDAIYKTMENMIQEEIEKILEGGKMKWQHQEANML